MRSEDVNDAAALRTAAAATNVVETATVGLHHAEALLEIERRTLVGRPPQVLLQLRLRAPGTLSHSSLLLEPGELREFVADLRALAAGSRTECGLRQPGANGSSVELRSLTGHTRYSLSMRCGQSTPGLTLTLRNWPVSTADLGRLLAWAEG